MICFGIYGGVGKPMPPAYLFRKPAGRMDPAFAECPGLRCIDQNSYCMASRSSRMVFSSMAESAGSIPTRLSRTASLLTAGVNYRAKNHVLKQDIYHAISKRGGGRPRRRSYRRWTVEKCCLLHSFQESAGQLK